MSDPKPFVLALPAAEDYIEILGEGKSVGLHSGRVLLLPGKDCGRHTTGHHEELIIVLSGEGELEVTGIGRTKICSGMVAYNPPQTEHNVINTGKEPLTYVYVVAPTA
ncbi:MAG: cupin domain-containing protein [candidate division Zixibacteria bacterium]|nr:cupin domain-containing protein [candidate division Zixibacteria bacterium]